MFIEIGYLDAQDNTYKHLFHFPREREHLYKLMEQIRRDDTKKDMYLKAVYPKREYHGFELPKPRRRFNKHNRAYRLYR